MRKRVFGLFAALLAFIPCCRAETLQLPLLSQPVIVQRLKAGEVSKENREVEIKHLFQAVGCKVEEQRVTKKSNNVVCTLPGQTQTIIVIGAHFDFVDKSGGKGIVDDWSGAALLPSLYETLKRSPRRHTLKFVAFAEEEVGMVGSTKFLKEESKEEISSIMAMINLECLGLNPPKVWGARSDPRLVQALLQVSNATNTPVARVDVGAVGDDDTHPFSNKKVPVLSVHSITQETLSVIHSGKDSLEAVHPDDYYNAYRLMSFYLAYLDGIDLPRALKK